MTNTETLLNWTISTLGDATLLGDPVLIAGDASPRKYYRLFVKKTAGDLETRILVSSPPTENNKQFLKIQGLLKSSAVRVPEVYASDLRRGFFLLEDLGDLVFLKALQSNDVEILYTKALNLLTKMMNLNLATFELPQYNQSRLQEELNVCPEWFFERALGLKIDRRARQLFQQLSDDLIEAALSQPFVFVHRDFHSRNIMCLETTQDLAIIDFQDGVVGPLTYDVASLLKDCYVVWPRSRQLMWLMSYRNRLERLGLVTQFSEVTWRYWFDLMGMQRHLKVLGVFSRLAYRDNKPSYLKDIPEVICYLDETVSIYQSEVESIRDFWNWFDRVVRPVLVKQTWYQRGFLD